MKLVTVWIQTEFYDLPFILRWYVEVSLYNGPGIIRCYYIHKKMSSDSENVSIVPNTTGKYLNTTAHLDDHCNWFLPWVEWLKIFLLTFGFLGNGMTVVIILVKKDLHQKTFATISLIALSDCLYCLCAILWGLFYYAYMDPHDYWALESCVSEFFDKYLKSALSLLGSTAYATSGFYIAVLSVFRYIIIAYPLKANIILTKRIVFATFFTVFLISIGYGFFKTLKINLSNKILKSLDLLVSYLIPLTVMVVFHTLKLLTLKRNTFRSTKNSTRKMEVVVIMVVMAYFWLLLPWHVLVISYEFQLFSPAYIPLTVSSLMLQLNNCINPVFYAFLSPRIREGICFCFVGKKGTKRKTPTATQSSNIYSSTANGSSCASLSTSTSCGPVTPSPTPNAQRVRS